MDMSTITQFISGVGFPVVAFLLIYKEMGKTREAHSEEIKSITDALNQNTRIIERLEASLQLLTMQKTNKEESK